MSKKILIVDDEESIRYSFESLLNDAGYQVATAASIPDCMQIVEKASFDLIYLDIAVGQENGLDALRDLKKRFPSCPIVMITGAPGSKTIIDAINHGASDYLAKPIRPFSLQYITEKVLAESAAS